MTILKLKQLFDNINFVLVISTTLLLLSFFPLFFFSRHSLSCYFLDTEQPLSVNFLRYKPGTNLKIPIAFINEDDNIEIKRGSYLHVISGYCYHSQHSFLTHFSLSLTLFSILDLQRLLVFVMIFHSIFLLMFLN